MLARGGSGHVGKGRVWSGGQVGTGKGLFLYTESCQRNEVLLPT